MDKATTSEERSDIPRADWTHKIFSAVEEKINEPYLNVCHYYVPILFRADKLQFSLIEEDKFKDTLGSIKKNKDFFMTCFVRRGNKNETVVGLQQKFKGTVPDKTIVSYNPDFHYRWTNTKHKVVTLTHHIGNLSSEALYKASVKLIKECETFLVTYTEEGDELLEKLSNSGNSNYGSTYESIF